MRLIEQTVDIFEAGGSVFIMNGIILDEDEIYIVQAEKGEKCWVLNSVWHDRQREGKMEAEEITDKVLIEKIIITLQEQFFDEMQIDIVA